MSLSSYSPVPKIYVIIVSISLIMLTENKILSIRNIIKIYMLIKNTKHNKKEQAYKPSYKNLSLNNIIRSHENSTVQ